MGVKRASKAALWSTHLVAFEASGQPRRDWCAAQGLNANTFGYWRCRLRDLAAATKAKQQSNRRLARVMPTVSLNEIQIAFR